MLITIPSMKDQGKMDEARNGRYARNRVIDGKVEGDGRWGVERSGSELVSTRQKHGSRMRGCLAKGHVCLDRDQIFGFVKIPAALETGDRFLPGYLRISVAGIVPMHLRLLWQDALDIISRPKHRDATTMDSQPANGRRYAARDLTKEYNCERWNWNW